MGRCCVLLLLLLASARSVDALMFQSANVSSQWDTCECSNRRHPAPPPPAYAPAGATGVFVENRTFYLFYLVTEHGPGEGFGVATSADGQHWDDRGFVYHGPSWSEHGWWMGTGSVWRAADWEQTGRYIVNWSQDPGKDGGPNNGSSVGAGFQNISFAESFDLIHWSRPAPLDTTFFSADPRHYHDFLGCGARWDCIYTIPVPQPGRNLSARDGYPRYGYWTASPLGCGCSGYCSQSVGFGETTDGTNWRALPSPQMVPPTVHWAEVGAVEYVAFTGKPGGKFYAMLGGNHNEKADMITYSGKMNSDALSICCAVRLANPESITIAADKPQGPFTAATKNCK